MKPPPLGPPSTTAPPTPASGEPASQGGSDRRGWLIAWLLTALVHGLAILGLWRLPTLQANPAAAREPEMVRLVLDAPNRPEAPRLDTELPADRADKAPLKADLLSDVTSRARDRVPGGDAALPRLAGAGDAPQVELARGHPPSGAAAAAARATPPPDDPAAQGAAAPWQKSVLLARRPAAEAAPRGTPGPAGVSTVEQPEMDSPDGNAALTGDVSLNTTAWDYAPWLDRFRDRLMELWFAPPAYRMGILKEGGWAVTEVEISRSGKLLRVDLLGQQGHPSLVSSALSALRAMPPIEPLPADFPEPTLILRVRMVYPRLRPR